MYVRRHSNVSEECTLVCVCMWCVHLYTSVCASQCISTNLYESTQCIHGGIHKHMLCAIVMCMYLHICIDPFCASKYMFVSKSVYMCRFMYVHEYFHMCKHTHTHTHTHGMLKGPWTHYFSNMTLQCLQHSFSGECTILIAVVLLPNKNRHITSQYSKAK
jgi:hypothetical protein